MFCQADESLATFRVEKPIINLSNERMFCSEKYVLSWFLLILER